MNDNIREWLRLVETQTASRRLWIGPQGEIIDLEVEDVSHAQMVLDHPERFGLSREIVDRDGMSEMGELNFDLLIALAEQQGWVRTSNDGAKAGSIAISAGSVEALHRACLWLVDHHILVDQADIDIEQLKGTVLHWNFVHLDDAALSRFLRTRRLQFTRRHSRVIWSIRKW